MSSFGIAQPFRCPSIVARMGRTVEKTEKVEKVEKKPIYDSDNSDRTDHSEDEEEEKKEVEAETRRSIQCRLQFSNIASRFSANKNVDHM